MIQQHQISYRVKPQPHFGIRLDDITHGHVRVFSKLERIYADMGQSQDTIHVKDKRNSDYIQFLKRNKNRIHWVAYTHRPLSEIKELLQKLIKQCCQFPLPENIILKSGTEEYHKVNACYARDPKFPYRKIDPNKMIEPNIIDRLSWAAKRYGNAVIFLKEADMPHIKDAERAVSESESDIPATKKGFATIVPVNELNSRETLLGIDKAIDRKRRLDPDFNKAFNRKFHENSLSNPYQVLPDLKKQ